MLSRVADAVYWMARYIERAVNNARFLDVNWLLTLDAPGIYEGQWAPLVMTTGDREYFFSRHDKAYREAVVNFLTFDPEYPNSILSCLRKARENARTIREIIPTELWEELNVFFHAVEHAARTPEDVAANPFFFCSTVKRHGFTIGGITGQVMAQDEVWQFLSLGRYLERADKTSRLLDVKYFLLLPSLESVGSALDHIQWSALLKAASAFQAYRHEHGRIRPDLVASFLLLNHEFHRAVLHCLVGAQHRLHDITGTRIGYFTNDAEKLLGILCADLMFHSIDDVLAFGLHEFTDQLQTKMNAVDQAVFQAFFTTLPVIDSPQEQ